MAEKVEEKVEQEAPKKKKREVLPGAKALQDIVTRVYQKAWDDKKAGKPVGWSASKFPCELAEVFDLAVVYPENQAAGIAARHDGERMCQEAEDMGYDNDICGYARISLAYAAGVETTNESRRVPEPDFVLCCNNICNCMTKWYENIARMHNIPLIMVDIPYRNEYGVSDENVEYLKAQFKDAIKQLEEISGKKFDEEKFKEVCANANRTSEAWLKVCKFCSYEPSPMSGFDLFNHMADVVTARAKPETAKAFEQLAEDLQRYHEEGKSTAPFKENYRILFEGIPCWPGLRNLYHPLKENGINVTAVVYAPAFGFVYDDIDSMARAYCKAPNSVSLEEGVEWRQGLMEENGVEGALINYNRSCKPWSGYMPEMQRRWTENLGIPCAAFDGDQADPRNFNVAQYETRVQGLVEAMEERRQMRKETK